MSPKQRPKYHVWRVVSMTAAAIFVLCIGLLWNQKKSITPKKCINCNVIIVSVDTLSATHLPCYGYFRNTAPNLCDFAGKNMLFTHAYSNATYTLPGHVSLFTGLFPRTHNVMVAQKDVLSEAVPFLPSILKLNGYSTVFFMPADSPHLPRNTVYNRGIDRFIDANKSTWKDALALFEQNVANGKKTFLFLHTYAVHPPFYEDTNPKLYTNDAIDWMTIRETDRTNITPNFIAYLLVAIKSDLDNGIHDADRGRYQDLLSSLESAAGNSLLQQTIVQNVPDIWAEYRGKYDPLVRVDPKNPHETAYLTALYDQKIHEFDAGPFREFLAFVSKDAIRKHTVIIVLSDHGEEFGEHGYISHRTLYESNTRTALVMAVPEGEHKTITDYVQSVDVMPTILDLLAIPGGPFQGISLVPLMSGARLANRLLVADTMYKQTLRLGKWKLFLDVRTGEKVPIELYDTEADPQEEQNVLFSHMSLAKRMIAGYSLFERRWASAVF